MKRGKNFSETRIPISTNGGKISATDWKKHFENLHSENREQVAPVIPENRPYKALNKPLKMKELLAVVKNMKNKKAEGIDRIANEMIKFFPNKILYAILCIFNGFLESGDILEDWCKGLITPLYKRVIKVIPITIGAYVLPIHF